MIAEVLLAAAFLPGFKFYGAPVAMPVLAYVTRVTSTSNASSYTFNSTSIGSAAADRFVVAAVTTRGDGGASGTISSVTFDGNAGTALAQSPNEEVNAGLFGRSKASGTTASIAVSTSAGRTGCCVDVYRVTGLSSTTPTDAEASSAANDTVRSVSIDVAADGVLIACAVSDTNTAGTAWTGATEDADGNIESDFQVSSASAAGLSSQTGRTITATWTGSNNVALAAITLR